MKYYIKDITTLKDIAEIEIDYQININDTIEIGFEEFVVKYKNFHFNQNLMFTFITLYVSNTENM